MFSNNENLEFAKIKYEFLYVKNARFVLLELSHIQVFMAKHRISNSLAHEIFQNYKSFSTKIHAFHVEVCLTIIAHIV